MTQKQKNDKREEFVVHIGPLMMKVLEQQKESIKEVTYDCTKPSYYEAAEVVAKKILGLT
jgi:hypothetical protein